GSLGRKPIYQGLHHLVSPTVVLQQQVGKGSLAQNEVRCVSVAIELPVRAGKILERFGIGEVRESRAGLLDHPQQLRGNNGSRSIDLIDVLLPVLQRA
ncbi:hypothetical protein ACH5AU_06775, partial [Streptomyces albidoflavus]